MMKTLKHIIWGTALALVGLSATNGAYGQSSSAGTVGNRVMRAAVGGCEGITINTSVDQSICNIENGVLQSSLTAQQEGASYQWLDCNNGNAPIQGATSRKFVVLEKGKYAVRITLGDCTANSICYDVQCVGSGGNGGGGSNCEGKNINTEVSQSNNGGTITLTAVQQEGATYQWYQWVGSNAPIENATSHTFSPTENGYYMVAITIGDCVKTSDYKGVIVVEGAFTTTEGETRSALDYTIGDIAFKSDDVGTGQLVDIPSEGLQVSGRVKLVKKFTVGKWYPVGFPFGIDNVSFKQNDNILEGVIYSGNKDEINYNNNTGISNHNYYVKYYDGGNNAFRFTDKFEANKGYIIYFPVVPFESDVVVEATFTSVLNPTIHSTSGTVGNYHGSNYTLVVNPNVVNVNMLAGATHYYQYNYDNQFVQVNTLSSLKPFETTVVYNGAVASAKYSAIGIDNGTTGINHPEDGKIIRTEYYNLMGTLVGMNDLSSLQSGVYIVKTIYESGKIKTEKQIIKK